MVRRSLKTGIEIKHQIIAPSRSLPTDDLHDSTLRVHLDLVKAHAAKECVLIKAFNAELTDMVRADIS